LSFEKECYILTISKPNLKVFYAAKNSREALGMRACKRGGKDRVDYKVSVEVKRLDKTKAAILDMAAIYIRLVERDARATTDWNPRVHAYCK
jgi:hypothetical protein